MSNKITQLYTPPSLLEQRRDMEECTSLSEATSNLQPQHRSEIFSSSSEDILTSGAMPGSAAAKQAILDKTRHKRVQAYMSLDSKSIAQTKGWRIRSAYRLVCYMARICGGLTGPMMLAHLLHDNFRPDPSEHPFTPPTSTEVFGMQYVIEQLQKLNAMDDTYTQSTISEHAGFTYLPPPIPDAFYPHATTRTIPYIRQSGTEPEGYNPMLDEPLGIWLDVYNHLSQKLRICDGTEDEPEAGVFGTVGMFTTNSARLLWPTRDELLIYEQELMLDTFDRLCGNGLDRHEEHVGTSVQAVEHVVMQELGYGRNEAVMLVKMALRYGTGVYESDIDMTKVRELKSLDVIADKASASNDPRAQIAARKQIELVAGLTKDSSSDQAEEFRSLASRALADRDDMDLLE